MPAINGGCSDTVTYTFPLVVAAFSQCKVFQVLPVREASPFRCSHWLSWSDPRAALGGMHIGSEATGVPNACPT